MNRKTYWLVTFLATVVLVCFAPYGCKLDTLYAQTPDCDAIVVDGAGVMGAKSANVAIAANSLINQGADVRVRTIEHSDNLDLTINGMQHECTSWQSADGGRKNTLVVLAVAPKDRKVGVYYGGAWNHAFNNSWMRITTDYMKPHFRDGDFAGGFIAALHQFSARAVASKDEALHPVVAQTTNIQQATDLSGLFHVFLWFYGLATVLIVGFSLYRVATGDKRRKEQAEAIQQRATIEKAHVADRIKRLRSSIDLALALHVPGAQDEDRNLGLVMEKFSELASQQATDPSQSGLTAEGYDTIYEAYHDLDEELDKIDGALADATEAPKEVEKDAPAQEKARAASAASPESSGHTVERSTTVIPIPIPIPYEREHESSTSSSSSSDESSDNDSGGGGSSSWSSSSSDDSGGGSSDFGSSDDSGGGGSDFGGGDSGGGGSSGF